MHILIFASILLFVAESRCQNTSIWNQNVAFNKSTRQSSLYEDYTSDLAVDGSSNQRARMQPRCAHTDLYDDMFWWTVDLADTFSITSVVVYGRTDCCVERLSNFEVLLYNREETMDNFNKSNAFLMYTHGDVTHPAVIRINCSNICIGRYVRIQIENGNAWPYIGGTKTLTLCEVEVYGEIYHPTPTDLPMSASFQDYNDSTTRATEMCRCPCKEKHADPNQIELEAADAMNEISDIIKTLKVNKTLLSKTKRSKTSSYDGRVTSKYIGICGSAILISILCLILWSDLLTVFNKSK